MLDNSTEMKIWRCTYPILIYLFVNMLVQVGFTIHITAKEFISLNDSGLINYFSTYNFSGDIERIVNENGLFVLVLSGLITIPICLRLMKKDEDLVCYKSVKEHIRQIKLSKWYYIPFLGIFASMGLSKLVTIIPIDNILGNYQEINNNIASNPLILKILGLVIIGPVVEELIFRGLIYKRLKGYTDVMKGVYISSAIFGIYHFNLVQGLYGFALGILLCFVYDKYKTIVAPIIVHISANLAALVAMDLSISEKINNNIYLKILFMILEIAALIAVLIKLNKSEVSNDL